MVEVYEREGKEARAGGCRGNRLLDDSDESNEDDEMPDELAGTDAGADAVAGAGALESDLTRRVTGILSSGDFEVPPGFEALGAPATTSVE